MRILLVDDDALITQAYLPILQTIPGTLVRCANTGGAAIQQATQMGGLDLLISDVVMDPLNGFQLRELITQKFPSAKILFMTGFDLSDYGSEIGATPILQKPVEPRQLLAAVESILNLNARPGSADDNAVTAPTIKMTLPPSAARPGGPSAAVARAVPAQPRVAVAQPAQAQQPAPVAQPAVPVARAVPAQPKAVAPAPVAAPAKTGVPSVRPVVAPASVAIPMPALPGKSQTQPQAPVARPTVPVPKTAVPVAAVAQPQAVPVAKPVTAPAVKAVPAARPASAPLTATPAALPASAPLTATPAARPASAPLRAVPVGRPSSAPLKAVPVEAPPVAQPAYQAAPAPHVTFSNESLVGYMLGAYQVVSELGLGRWGKVYAAVQVSINRPVGLTVLDSAFGDDEASKGRFFADARAKAHVQHPSIMAVYEAGESDGRCFFAHEYVDGMDLSEYPLRGMKLAEPLALKVMRVAAEGLQYLSAHNIPHNPLEPRHIHIGVDAQARMSNIATEAPDRHLTVPEEIQALGRAIQPATGEMSPGLRTLIARMTMGGPQGFSDWGQLLQGIKALEPRVVPVEAARISAQDRKAIQAVETARRTQRRSLMITGISLAALVAVVLWLVLDTFVFTGERTLNQMLNIPAGSYTLSNGRTVKLEEFWIDKYEITFAQYAAFLRYLEKNPDHATDFNHPDQPRFLDHVPPNWEIFYKRARQQQPVHKVAIDLNCPVVEINWWDAYAYAKWRHGEDGGLPTVEQWEAAAGGTDALKYPWGDEFESKKVNSGADFNQSRPEEKGKVDGYNFWNPVDAVTGDKSPFGVIGMAGNVSEFTATWTPDKKFPIVKGGSFMSRDVSLARKIEDHDPNKRDTVEHIGFRTISKRAPKGSKSKK